MNYIIHANPGTYVAVVYNSLNLFYYVYYQPCENVFNFN